MRAGPLLALVATAGAACLVHSFWTEPSQTGGLVHVVILHTNDMHGQALPLPPVKGDKRKRGGFPALKAAVDRERKKARLEGHDPILVDAGDVWVGPPEGSRTEGAFVAEVMNRFRYDVCEVGNHEFDHGPDKVVRLAGLVHFPLLGANVEEEKTRATPPWLRRSVVVARDGVAFRFIGLLTSKIHEVTTNNATKGLVVEDEAPVVERELAACDPGEVPVLVTHIGEPVDRELARKFHGRIQLIVGGHTHEPIPGGERVPVQDPVLIVNTGSSTRNLGRVDLYVDRETKRILSSEERLIPIHPEEGEDPEIAALVDEEHRECEAQFGARIGSVTEALTRSPRHAPSALGSLYCDVVRDFSGADVAFTNPHGLRADLPAGDVLLRNIYEFEPFGNTVVTMTFSGAELRKLLEEMLTVENLECSGIEVQYDSKAPAGSRLVSVTIGGKPLDDKRIYKIATNNFLAGGKDNYHFFAKGHDPLDTYQLVRDLVIDEFKKIGQLPTPKWKGRMVDVSDGHSR